MNNPAAIQPGRPAGASRNLFAQRARMRKDLPAMSMVIAQFREAEKTHVPVQVTGRPENGTKAKVSLLVRKSYFKKFGDSEIEFNHYLGMETLMYILSCQTGLHPDLFIGTKQKGQGSNIFADGCLSPKKNSLADDHISFYC